ncbi:hypothetical protein [Deinococcus altitudinis]|uniref:hypothetical protein n=1 Tax=Deinococcus altitudinis TaxID=468914 RepID=UPI00389284CD
MKQGIGAAFLAGVLVAALLLTVVLPRFFQQAVYRSTQPSSVAYHSYDPYSLTINERGINWTTLPPSKRYQLFVGRALDFDHTYGYRLDYSFHSQSTTTQTAIGQVHAVWSASGVTLIEESGQRVFIPQDLFTGGR